MTRRQAMCLAVIMIALYLLTGCLGTRQSETGAVTGVVAGQPLVLKWTRDTEGQTTLEIPPALLTAATAAAGATPWGGIVATALALLPAIWGANRQGAATAANTRADEHKADSDEAWAKLVPEAPAK